MQMKERRDIPNAPISLPSGTGEVESEVSMSDTIFDFPSQKHVSAEIVRKDENMERDVFHREVPRKHPEKANNALREERKHGSF